EPDVPGGDFPVPSRPPPQSPSIERRARINGGSPARAADSALAACPPPALSLVLVCLHDRLDQLAEARLVGVMTDGVLQLDAPALAADEASFAQDLKMLRQGRFRHHPIAHLEKRRANLWAVGLGDLGVDLRPYGVGERVQDALDSDVLGRGMEERPHVRELAPVRPEVHSSLLTGLR